MARVFKRAGCKTYHIEFFDVMGHNRRVIGYTDKDASEEMGRMLDRAVAMRQAGGLLSMEMLKWLEMLPPRIRNGLAKWNVIDPQRAAAGRPLKEHVDDWAAMLEAKGDNPRYIQNVHSHVIRIANGCNWRNLSDVTAISAQKWLAEKRKAGTSVATSNGYIRSLKGFLNWLVSERRITENCAAHVKTMNAKTDPRYERRALAVEEIGKLLAATEAGGKHHGLTGHERALLYRLALETGLRYSEIHSLTRGAFNLESTPATVTAKAAYTKNGQEAVIPLRPELAADLKKHLALILPLGKAFPGMQRNNGAEMLVVDLKAAGIPVVDESGRILDFHSLRHTFGSMLAASGVHPKVAQDLMRHSTINLTMNIYTHTALESRMGALAKLPELKAAQEDSTKVIGVVAS